MLEVQLRGGEEGSWNLNLSKYHEIIVVKRQYKIALNPTFTLSTGSFKRSLAIIKKNVACEIEYIYKYA